MTFDHVLVAMIDAVVHPQARRPASSFSSELAVPMIVAPAMLASCTAAEPIPLPTE